MLNKDNIDQLLLKHLLQENAVEEEQLLKEWLGHDPEHQRYFERSVGITFTFRLLSNPAVFKVNILNLHPV